MGLAANKFSDSCEKSVYKRVPMPEIPFGLTQISIATGAYQKMLGVRTL